VAQSSGVADRDQEALAGELADLLYHVLVLSAERGLPPARTIDVLRERHGG
jgi:phosphoribosyl-ATP pyrophosphohydrolase